MRVLLPWSGRRTNNSDSESCGSQEGDLCDSLLPADCITPHEQQHEESSSSDEGSQDGENDCTGEDSVTAATLPFSPSLLPGVSATPSPAVFQAELPDSSSSFTTTGSPRISKRRAAEQNPANSQPSAEATTSKRLRSADSKPAAKPDNTMAVGGRRKVDDEGEQELGDESGINYIVSSSNAHNTYWQQPSENQPPPALPNDPLRGVASLPENNNPSAASIVDTTDVVEPPATDQFRQALQQRGLELVEQEGDGNCLFRAVSLQVYGQADNHAQVREQCIDFMARNEEHYSNFVAAEALSFQDYITVKRRDGVHGNHAEIQAISELFNRPVEVYESSLSGISPTIQPMNIFHAEYTTADAPIRLSYHNNNHYNAVIDPLVPTAGLGLGLPGLKPGLADTLQVTQAKAESDRMADDMELQRILKESKDEHKEKEEDQLQRILKASSVDFMYKQKAMALSDLDATNFELEQKALASSMEGSSREQGRKKRAAARRRRPSPVMEQEQQQPAASSMFASIPSSAVASLPAAASAAAESPPVFGVHPLGVGGEYPQAVEDLVMNGFDLPKVLRAYDLVGDNFDDLLSFLLSGGGGGNHS